MSPRYSFHSLPGQEAGGGMDEEGFSSACNAVRNSVGGGCGMIGVLEIKNFKSIKSLRLDCRRVNVFIGGPNTGKSNILESLGLLSFAYYSSGSVYKARDFVRFENTTNLFHDGDVGEAIVLGWDSNSMVFQLSNGKYVGIGLDVGLGLLTFGVRVEDFVKDGLEGDLELVHLEGDLKDFGVTSDVSGEFSPFKLYRFAVRQQFEGTESHYLLPPFGDNMVALLLSHKEIRSLANDLFSPLGLRLGIRPHEHKIEVIKEYEDVIISYPYSLVSDTLQRLIFHLAAVKSNKDSVLVFEEPEAHAFPYYTKYLAETIGLDDAGNQYFISTHNPYFLLPLVEKVRKDEIAVFVTYYEDYQTKVKQLTDEQLGKLDEIDVFLNIESLVGS